MDLKRVYYSAFIPVSFDTRLPAIGEPPLLREHRLYQADWLLRFRETQDGVLYAPMEPDHFILPLVAPHFSVRLAKERWLIHDVRREKGVLYDGGGWILADLELEESPVFTDDERHWQHLWQTFFRRVAIGERLNPRRQRSFMPMKYWKYLVEMENEPR
jgi:probable DNA metabolism protein|nr:TIGR03915 family putative DNA repair protein [Geoalkalibacter subterraneus]